MSGDRQTTKQRATRARHEIARCAPNRVNQRPVLRARHEIARCAPNRVNQRPSRGAPRQNGALKQDLPPCGPAGRAARGVRTAGRWVLPRSEFRRAPRPDVADERIFRRTSSGAGVPAARPHRHRSRAAQPATRRTGSAARRLLPGELRAEREYPPPGPTATATAPFNQRRGTRGQPREGSCPKGSLGTSPYSRSRR